VSDENKTEKKEIYYMPATLTLNSLVKRGYSRKQADDICWWALSEEFQHECEKRGKDVATTDEDEMVSLFLEKYHIDPESGEITTSKPLTGIEMGNAIVGLLFVATFIVTLWFVL
jgi:hypothetical protein